MTTGQSRPSSLCLHATGGIAGTNIRETRKTSEGEQADYCCSADPAPAPRLGPLRLRLGWALSGVSLPYPPPPHLWHPLLARRGFPPPFSIVETPQHPRANLNPHPPHTCLLYTAPHRTLHLAPGPRAGRTEIITNDQNPNFTAQFSLTYLFEEVQRVRLEVYDVDTAYKSSDAAKLDLGRQDFQGENNPKSWWRREAVYDAKAKVFFVRRCLLARAESMWWSQEKCMRSCLHVVSLLSSHPSSERRREYSIDINAAAVNESGHFFFGGPTLFDAKD